MTPVIRLIVSMLRPSLLVVLMLFAAIGLAQAGHAEELHPLGTTVLVVASWFLHAAAVNDLADELIDRVNLPGVGARPLASGQTTRRELLLLALASGTISLLSAFAVNWRVGLVVIGGLALSAAYSLPPVRLSARGGLASAILPAAYVVLPFLVGVLTVQPTLGGDQLALLAALWVGFAGRILLKDFRDVEGDAQFGKATFLLRHGRATTCAVSTACWIVGTGSLVLLLPVGHPAALALLAFLAFAIWGLRELARLASRFDETALISAVAMVGRGMAVAVFASYSMADLGHPYGRQLAVMATVTGLFLWVAWSIVLEPELARPLPGELAEERTAQTPATL